MTGWFTMVVALACTAATPDAVDSGTTKAAVSFTEQIHPLFMEHCAGCHAGDNAQADFDMTDPTGASLFETLNVGCDWGDGLEWPDRVVPFEAEYSPLAWKIREDLKHPQECGREMPASGTALIETHPELVDLIETWIAEGAVID